MKCFIQLVRIILWELKFVVHGRGGFAWFHMGFLICSRNDMESHINGLLWNSDVWESFVMFSYVFSKREEKPSPV